MATQTATPSRPDQDSAVETKIQQFRKLFAGAREIGKQALENARHELSSDARWFLATRIWIAAHFSLALTIGAAPVVAQAAPPVRNIVLVHGAFADGSSWSKVIPILQAKGFNVTAVQNPLTSFADDLAATKRALAQQKGPVILVGHSWAGVVITEAGVDPNVVGLVYVAAFGPDVGETVGDLGKKYPPPPAFTAPIVDQQGFMSLPTDAVLKHFASDLPPSEARVVAATQGPVASSAFDARVSAAAWKTKPSWYIVAKRDGAIAPDEERFFAKRMNATTTELNSSHVAMLSQPAAVATVIIDAAMKALTTGTASSTGRRQ